MARVRVMQQPGRSCRGPAPDGCTHHSDAWDLGAPGRMLAVAVAGGVDFVLQGFGRFAALE